MRKLLKDAKGSSAIPMTPFLENGDIDYKVLEKEIDWICSQNVGSICGPVNVSEFMVLTDEERTSLIKAYTEITNNRTAVIVNVAATNIKDAVRYTEYAEKCGADAVIAMPPYVGELDFSSVKEYYNSIAKSTSLPVMIQNQHFPNIAISVDNILELCAMQKNISWIKQETTPAKSVDELNRKRTADIEGIMSGFSGLYSTQDFLNGAIATIHACEYCDLVQKLWDYMFNGEMQKAYDLQTTLTPALILEGLYTWQYTKYIMEKRGIFKNHITRNKKDVLTKTAITQIDTVWENIKKHI